MIIPKNQRRMRVSIQHSPVLRLKVARELCLHRNIKRAAYENQISESAVRKILRNYITIAWVLKPVYAAEAIPQDQKELPL